MQPVELSKKLPFIEVTSNKAYDLPEKPGRSKPHARCACPMNPQAVVRADYGGC
jgi:hypothetical protein